MAFLVVTPVTQKLWVLGEDSQRSSRFRRDNRTAASCPLRKDMTAHSVVWCLGEPKREVESPRRQFLGTISRCMVGLVLLPSPIAGAAQAEPQTLKAVCVITGTAGNESLHGIVRFSQSAPGAPVLVEASLSGLQPGKHGFHVHASGDISAPDATSAGPHFNPSGMQHGDPDGSERHAGDLGNITADKDGNASIARDFTTGIQLSGVQSIIGRAIIVHKEEDDLVTQPTGNAGARVGYGVIGIAS
mmetsp:Transcript_24495/g.42126  ORF Transcript_24495/g.42126 Transcript_24495/m.42126 type:complete len:245 (-) Transcript_24495:520-1254(-)|eukprot:CAMPEP_0196666742 /NCGR_PEP_ID=MMETSP1086-20130531/64687_1 /TAXON_ID=77921 /ORGANISM="Cyanoptyche  gloeocystis , Strain SAG4.97" /LENGTH=244 /DNA_ID=CAMNT_0042003979 /DNA_START=66 /DNA_END=800 /DNA_ORIENTATION=+